MPKIVIHEIDNTKSPANEYQNFSVAIAGPVADGKGATGFDENGVVELTTRAEFEDIVGKVKGIEIEGKYATITNTKTGGDWESDPNFDNIKNYLYTSAWAEHIPGKFRLYTKQEYEGETNYFKYTKFTGSIEERTSYSLILAGNEGYDAYNGISGNQIAYELLGLGYTVLYKKYTDVSELADDTFWEPLKDKSNYDFRYILNGLVTANTEANKAIAKLARHTKTNQDGRGDCIALCDIDYKKYTEGVTSMTDRLYAIEAEAQLVNTADKNTAFFANGVTYNILDDADFGNNKTFPASFHYLACAAKASNNFAEWYAVSGYTRGVSDYEIKAVEVKFGDVAADILQPRSGDKTITKNNNTINVKKAVNLVTKARNMYYLWGNRTAETLEQDTTQTGSDTLKASHFLNIRQLCTTIKKQAYVSCRRFSFDPNSDVLWINFKNSLTPMFDGMKADQGLTDYRFIKVNDKRKAMLNAKIRIVPIEAVEDFDIGLYLEDSIAGADISEE